MLAAATGLLPALSHGCLPRGFEVHGHSFVIFKCKKASLSPFPHAHTLHSVPQHGSCARLGPAPSMGADVGEAFNKAEASLQSLLLPEALPTPTLYSPYLYTHGYILTSLPRPLGLWERTLWWLLLLLCCVISEFLTCSLSLVFSVPWGLNCWPSLSSRGESLTAKSKLMGPWSQMVQGQGWLQVGAGAPRCPWVLLPPTCPSWIPSQVSRGLQLP